MLALGDSTRSASPLDAGPDMQSMAIECVPVLAIEDVSLSASGGIVVGAQPVAEGDPELPSRAAPSRPAGAPVGWNAGGSSRWRSSRGSFGGERVGSVATVLWRRVPGGSPDSSPVRRCKSGLSPAVVMSSPGPPPCRSMRLHRRGLPRAPEEMIGVPRPRTLPPTSPPRRCLTLFVLPELTVTGTGVAGAINLENQPPWPG